MNNLFMIFERILTHPIGRANKIRTLGRFIFWQLICRFVGDYSFRWINNSRLLISKGMTGATGCYYCGLLEFEEMCFAAHLLGEEWLFIDVGANVGVYTVLASSVGKAKSISVEPDERARKRLAKNIEINQIGSVCDVIDAVLTDHPGHIQFSEGLDVENRVLTSKDNVEGLKKTATTLDQLHDHTKKTLIKIDVEGHESFVLKGAVKTLAADSCAALIIETVDDESERILQEFDFVEIIYDPAQRSVKEYCEGNRRAYNRIYVKRLAMPGIRQRIMTSSELSFLNFSV